MKNMSFDDCLLNRREYGEFIASFIKSKSGNFVLNINGEWGTGKSHFLKMLQTLLSHEKHPTVYFDAWKSDFTENALTAITCEIIGQLEKQIKRDVTFDSFNKAKSTLSKITKSATLLALGILANKTIGDSGSAVASIENMLKDDSQLYIDSMSKIYHEQMDAIDQVRDELAKLAEELSRIGNLQLPIVVLVDELDRCRPPYAISVLEAIKHLFSADGFVFVIATDTQQLSHSIRVVYGAEFDGERYLRRFFDRTATLPEPNIEHYLTSKKYFSEYHEHQKELALFPNYHSRNIPLFISILRITFKTTIRDIDQIANKYDATLAYAISRSKSRNRSQLINYFVLIYLLFLNHHNHGDYHKINNDSFNTSGSIETIPMGNIPLSNFITENMMTAINHERVNPTITGSATVRGLPTRYEFETKYNEVSSADWNNFIQAICGQLQSYHNNTSNFDYWLASDYKKIIDMTATLS